MGKFFKTRDELFSYLAESLGTMGRIVIDGNDVHGAVHYNFGGTFSKPVNHSDSFSILTSPRLWGYKDTDFNKGSSSLTSLREWGYTDQELMSVPGSKNNNDSIPESLEERIELPLILTTMREKGEYLSSEDYLQRNGNVEQKKKLPGRNYELAKAILEYGFEGVFNQFFTRFMTPDELVRGRGLQLKHFGIVDGINPNASEYVNLLGQKLKMDSEDLAALFSSQNTGLKL